MKENLLKILKSIITKAKEKKLIIIFFTPVFFLSLIVALLLFIDPRTISLDSPLNPIVLTTKQLIPIKPIERWQAKGIINSEIPLPENQAKAILLLDFESEKIIYQKNAEEKLPVASLSKLMTTTVALEMAQLDQLLKVTSEATSCGEAAVGLKDSEGFTVKELLYGMLLVSGNDAAEVLARNISEKGREKFIFWMNQKAKNLGLKQTSFINPTGLDEDDGGVNYSSAGDLAALFYYLHQNFPVFKNIFLTKEFVLKENPYHQQYDFLNTSWDFADNYPYLLGGKSGNTDKAGFCLLALAKKGEHQLLLITLGEPDFKSIKENTQKFFDYGFGVLESN